MAEQSNNSVEARRRLLSEPASGEVQIGPIPEEQKIQSNKLFSAINNLTRNVAQHSKAIAGDTAAKLKQEVGPAHTTTAGRLGLVGGPLGAALAQHLSTSPAMKKIASGMTEKLKGVLGKGKRNKMDYDALLQEPGGGPQKGIGSRRATSAAYKLDVQILSKASAKERQVASTVVLGRISEQTARQTKLLESISQKKPGIAKAVKHVADWMGEADEIRTKDGQIIKPAKFDVIKAERAGSSAIVDHLAMQTDLLSNINSHYQQEEKKTGGVF